MGGGWVGLVRIEEQEWIDLTNPKQTQTITINQSEIRRRVYRIGYNASLTNERTNFIELRLLVTILDSSSHLTSSPYLILSSRWWLVDIQLLILFHNCAWIPPRNLATSYKLRSNINPIVRHPFRSVPLVSCLIRSSSSFHRALLYTGRPSD